MAAKSLKEWLDGASAERRAALFDRLGGASSVRSSIYMLAQDPSKSSHRGASAARAARIESAIADMARLDPTVPLLSRGCICKACSECPHWLKDNN
ncbi:MAG: hypothetical protein PHQ40_16465 [Anaerolineaceae bacterium]|nr:hypothetical protein [Anaerolineaceae bacterium]